MHGSNDGGQIKTCCFMILKNYLFRSSVVSASLIRTSLCATRKLWHFKNVTQPSKLIIRRTKYPSKFIILSPLNPIPKIYFQGKGRDTPRSECQDDRIPDDGVHEAVPTESKKGSNKPYLILLQI